MNNSRKAAWGYMIGASIVAFSGIYPGHTVIIHIAQIGSGFFFAAAFVAGFGK